jgi:Kelch motif protein/galactose oxidase-like protein
MRPLLARTISMSGFAIASASIIAAASLVSMPAARATSPYGAGSAAGGTWAATGSLRTGRVQPMAATLPGGKVLVAGGFNAKATQASAELYDPTTGRWSLTGAMALGRYTATMTVLPTGKVLVAGGRVDGSPDVTTKAELYDPATGRWSTTGAMLAARASHTATLLASGKVLVAGGVGVDQTISIASAELYDPATGAWSRTGSMSTGRERHTASRLGTGRVLVSGGSLNYLDGAEGSAESYDPRSGRWSLVGRMTTSRFSHTATALADGTILVAGGSYGNFAAWNSLAMSDRYDPQTSGWIPTGDMQVAVGSVPTISGRELHTATLISNGRVLVAGGDGYLTDFTRSVTFRTAELFDPSLGTWTLTGSMKTGRVEHAAVALIDGRALVVGGSGGHANVLASAEIYTPPALRSSARAVSPRRDSALSAPSHTTGPASYRAHRVVSDATLTQSAGKWTQTGPMHVARAAAPATLLPNGHVLVEGCAVTGSASMTAELYDPVHGTWSMTGSMRAPRCGHVALLMRDGRVLVAGGDAFAVANSVWSSAEVYDPNTGRWSPAGRMNSTRYFATIVMLSNGKLLVSGGNAINGLPRDSVDLYDPASGTWTATPSLNVSRNSHGAANLPGGKVLVQGGFTLNNGFTQTGELYDPLANAWTFTGSTEQQSGHIVTASGGKPLSTDEPGNGPTGTTSELYDQATGKWTPTAGKMHFSRANDAATELADGRVLVSGGCFGVSSCRFIAQAEVFSLVNQTWSLDAPMITPREEHSAALLADGRVLVAGGLDQNLQVLTSAEIYAPGSGAGSPAKRRLR